MKRVVRGFDVALFDLDGTLSDSAPGIVASLEHAFVGLELPVPGNLLRSIGPPLPVMLEQLGVPVELHDSFIDAYRSRYATIGLFENELYEGIADVVSALSANGVALAVATSKPEPYAVRILEYFGLSRLFDVIAGATLDGTRGAKADVIAHCLAQRSPVASDRIIMIGDRHHDIRGAAHHGIRAIGVTWGYGDQPELVAAGARWVVDRPDELVDLIV